MPKKPKFEMNEEVYERMYRFLMFLKVARRTDNKTCIDLLLGSDFLAHVEPIEEMLDWTREDNERATEIAKKLMKETDGFKSKDRTDKMSKSILAWSLAGLAAAATGGAAYYLHRKKSANRDSKEKKDEK